LYRDSLHVVRQRRYACCVKDGALQAQFKTVNEAVVLALQQYIETETAGPLAHPSGTFAIGADQFARRLALQEGRDLPLATYERVGMAALTETKNAFVALLHPR